MKRRPELPKDVQDKINEAARKARPFWQSNDFKGALPHMLKAWDLIPEPKTSWDFFAQTMSRTFVSAYTKTGDFANARAWVKIMRESYDAPQVGDEPTVDFCEAEFLYHADEKDRAFEIFDQLYKQYKKRPFQEEDKALWDFYKKRAGL